MGKLPPPQLLILISFCLSSHFLAKYWNSIEQLYLTCSSPNKAISVFSSLFGQKMHFFEIEYAFKGKLLCIISEKKRWILDDH